METTKQLRYRQALILVRLVVGAVFIYYGSQKVFGVMGGPGYTDWIAANQGFEPAILAPVVVYLVPWIEFLGGLGLVAGLFTRLSSLGIACVMAGAIFQHIPDGPGPKLGWGYPAMFLLLALALLIAGPSGGLDELLFGGSGNNRERSSPDAD